MGRDVAKGVGPLELGNHALAIVLDLQAGNALLAYANETDVAGVRVQAVLDELRERFSRIGLAQGEPAHELERIVDAHLPFLDGGFSRLPRHGGTLAQPLESLPLAAAAGNTLASPLMRSFFLIMLMSSSALAGQDRTYRYLHLDVFTDQVLTGNQLAVFLAPAGLSAEEMQLIAREMNFSESTFVLPPEAQGTDFRVRIFTPRSELDFAGHPTIGTAFALARAGKIAPLQKRVVLGEGIGPVPVDLEWKGRELDFAWMYQLEPTFGKTIEDLGAVATALGVEAKDVEASGLPVQEVSCGATFLFVPMATRAAVDRAALDRAAMGSLLEKLEMQRRGVFIFSKEPGGDDATVYSRMLSFGGNEDPADGKRERSPGLLSRAPRRRSQGKGGRDPEPPGCCDGPPEPGPHRNRSGGRRHQGSSRRRRFRFRGRGHDRARLALSSTIERPV